MFNWSISAASTCPIPMDRALAINSSYRPSRWVRDSFLESLIPAMTQSGGKTTAAATTGPAKQPRPASSTPATRPTPCAQRRRSKCRSRSRRWASACSRASRRRRSTTKHRTPTRRSASSKAQPGSPLSHSATSARIWAIVIPASSSAPERLVPAGVSSIDMKYRPCIFAKSYRERGALT